MIKTESGYVSGITTKDGTVSIFKGIPDELLKLKAFHLTALTAMFLQAHSMTA